jgi:5-methylcytosine-specific restriction endonuclease McrA
MTIKKIPGSIQEIIKSLIRFQNEPLTYKHISMLTNSDTNTTIQRINRHQEFFDIKEPRPYKISLKKEIKEIYFFRDDYQCQICLKVKKPENLLIRFKDPYMEDKYDWENVITSCESCKEKDLIKRIGVKKEARLKLYSADTWEYKGIEIKNVEKYDKESKELRTAYYEFNELNGQGWFHLINNANEISSNNPIDILNYFGDDGWEIIKYKEFPWEDYEEFHAEILFKRKKLKDKKE